MTWLSRTSQKPAKAAGHQQQREHRRRPLAHPSVTRLESRAQEYAQDAARKLKERAEAEAKAMQQILQDQRTHIERTAAKYEQYDARQLRLDFADNEDELRQLESNRKYWTKRLLSLQRELKSEPERIRAVYEIKATRIEPVGLAYLWPVTG